VSERLMWGKMASCGRVVLGLPGASMVPTDARASRQKRRPQDAIPSAWRFAPAKG